MAARETDLLRENHLTFIGVGVALLVAYNLPPGAVSRVKAGVRETVAPYQGMAMAVRRAVGRMAEAGNAARERAEREALSEWDRRRLSELEAENARLRASLGFAAASAHRLVACEVIARDEFSGWWRMVRVDRGSSAGVEPGMPVMAADGLVGLVREVSPRTADVVLLSDPSFRVAARLPRTGDLGVIVGGGVTAGGTDVLSLLCPPEPETMTYVPREADVRPGDEVVTSGLGGVFPAGLLVGRVLRVTRPEPGLYQEAAIAPAADLGRLTYVFVIIDGLSRLGGAAAPEGGR